jgi:hypothetical protein
MNAKFWIRDLINYCEINNYKIPKLSELILPGTHHSALHKGTLNPINPINHKLFSKIKFILPFIKRTLSKWSETQHLTITEQLNIGVRYFDIRVSYTKNDIYVSHSFQAMKLTEVFKEFEKYYDNNGTSEVIIINIKRDFENKEFFDITLFKKILENTSLIKYISNSSINKKINLFGNKPIIINLSEYIYMYKIRFSYNYDSSFPDTNNVNELFKYVSYKLKEIIYLSKKYDEIYPKRLRLIITPNIKNFIYIFINIFCIVIIFLSLIILLITSIIKKFKNLKLHLIIHSSINIILILTIIIVNLVYINKNNLYKLNNNIKPKMIDFINNNIPNNINYIWNVIETDFINTNFCNYLININKLKIKTNNIIQ